VCLLRGVRVYATHIMSATDFSRLRRGTRVLVFNAHLFGVQQVLVPSSFFRCYEMQLSYFVTNCVLGFVLLFDGGYSFNLSTLPCSHFGLFSVGLLRRSCSLPKSYIASEWLTLLLLVG